MSRPYSVTLVILLGLALLALMWVGWRARARRTAGVGAASVEPTAAATLVVVGVYVSSTTAGEWLDRIAADGLGVRSPVVVEVGPDGVWLRRRGAPQPPGRIRLVISARTRMTANRIKIHCIRSAPPRS